MREKANNKGRKPTNVKSKYLGTIVRDELLVKNISQSRFSDYLNCDERTLRAKMKGDQGFSASDLNKIDDFFSFEAGFARNLAYYGAAIFKPGRTLVCGFTGSETSLAVIFINSALLIFNHKIIGMVTVIDRNNGNVLTFNGVFREAVSDGYIRSLSLKTESGDIIIGGYNACIERYALQCAIVSINNCDANNMNKLFSEVPLLSIIISDSQPLIPNDYREFNDLTIRILKIGCRESFLKFIEKFCDDDLSHVVRVELFLSVIRRAAYTNFYEELSCQLIEIIIGSIDRDGCRASILIEAAAAFSSKRKEDSLFYLAKINSKFIECEEIHCDIIIAILASFIQIKVQFGINADYIMDIYGKMRISDNLEKNHAIDALLKRYFSLYKTVEC